MRYAYAITAAMLLGGATATLALQDPLGGGEAQDENPLTRIVVAVKNGTQYGVLQAGPGFSRAANDLRTWIDQYKGIAKLDLGAHKIKGGVEFNKAHIYNLFVQNATGTLVFRNIDDLRAGLLSPGVANGTICSPTTRWS